MTRILILFLLLVIVTPGLTKQLVVDLVAFNTEHNQSTHKVDIYWETATESDIAGFHIYRSDQYGAIGVRVNSSIIRGKGSSTIGATYDLVDEPDKSGRYYYQLAEVSLSGGVETYYRPYADGDGELAYDDFIKVYQHEESVTGGEYYWFNDGSTGNPGDGRKVSIIVTSTSSSGTITVKQTNAEPDGAPGANVCPWRWEITSDIVTSASIDFFYNTDDITGISENSDYIGLAKFDEATNTWKWVGGTVIDTDHKIQLDDVIPQGYYVLYRRIYGDVSGDGYVGAADLQRFGDVWLDENSGEFNAGSDARFFNCNKTTVNGKQIINAADLQVFGDNWLNGTP